MGVGRGALRVGRGWRPPAPPRRDPPPHPAYVVGYAAAGNVVEVGEGVEGVAVGQLVTTLFLDGSHVEPRAVPAALAWPVPDGVDAGAAAALPSASPQPTSVLSIGAASEPARRSLSKGPRAGSGTAAIELAKGAGATVIVTASSPQRLDRLAGMGADHGIDYLTEDVAARVMELTGGGRPGRRPGGDHAAVVHRRHKGKRCVRPGGQRRTGPDHRRPAPCPHGQPEHSRRPAGREILTERMHAAVADLLDRLAAGKFEVIIDRTFPLSEAAAAHAILRAAKPSVGCC